MTFDEFNLSEPVRAGIRDVGFTEPTKVQVESLTHSLSGRDVTVQSQTGTGKTAAFLISIFELLTQNESFKGRKALVVAPTRELAVQIEDEANRLGAHVGLNVACFYGGVGYGKQEDAIAEGVDIIVGTPGRLLDFAQSGKIKLNQVGICVIDEADRLFDMGFYPDIQRIMKGMVPRTERLTMLYSATLSIRVLHLAYEYMNDPAEVEIEPEHITVQEVQQEVLHASRDEKMRVLLGLIQREDPGSCLVFSNTKSGAEQVAKRLEVNGYGARFMMGDLPQQKRLQILEAMKEGTTRFLVATDVAARGLHIDDLDLVVNYDVPEDPESYVHRIGRTARAGRSGKAYTIACERFVYGLEPIEKLIGMKIPVGRVTDELLVEDKSEGIHIRTGDTKGGSSRGRPAHGSRGRPERRPRREARGERTGGRPARGPARASQNRGGREQSGERDKEQRAHVAESHGPSGGKGGSGDAGESRKSRRRGNGGAGRPRRHEPNRTTAANTAKGEAGAPSRDTSLDDRLEYYRRKYGEDFVPGDIGESESGGNERDAKGARSAAGGNDPGAPGGERSSRKRRSRGRRGSRGSGGNAKSGASSPSGKGQRAGTGPSEAQGAQGDDRGARNRSEHPEHFERSQDNEGVKSREAGSGESRRGGNGIVSKLRRLFGGR
ncbi:MAG: DEAD/DEAH box helicase [Spirochaetia bacterium]